MFNLQSGLGSGSDGEAFAAANVMPLSSPCDDVLPALADELLGPRGRGEEPRATMEGGSSGSSWAEAPI